jgi:hypothetical protein
LFRHGDVSAVAAFRIASARAVRVTPVMIT